MFEQEKQYAPADHQWAGILFIPFKEVGTLVDPENGFAVHPLWPSLLGVEIGVVLLQRCPPSEGLVSARYVLPVPLPAHGKHARNRRFFLPGYICSHPLWLYHCLRSPSSREKTGFFLVRYFCEA